MDQGNQTAKSKPDVSMNQPQHPLSDTEPVELQDQADPPIKEQEDVEEEIIDKREQETLDMLAKFQQQIKNKNILKWMKKVLAYVYLWPWNVFNLIKHKNFYKLDLNRTIILLSEFRSGYRQLIAYLF